MLVWDFYLNSNFLSQFGEKKVVRFFPTYIKKSCSLIYFSSAEDTVPKSFVKSKSCGVTKRWKCNHFNFTPNMLILVSNLFCQQWLSPLKSNSAFGLVGYGMQKCCIFPNSPHACVITHSISILDEYSWQGWRPGWGISKSRVQTVGGAAHLWLTAWFA